jgi:hypothetical protein
MNEYPLWCRCWNIKNDKLHLLPGAPNIKLVLMTISLALLLEQSAMFRCLEGLKSGSFLVRSHKVDTRIYIV